MARNRKKSINCGNCSFAFSNENNFCPNCGQENHTHKLPVGHFVYEFVESITHFDTKVFNTFKEMTIKPGLVVKNYNSNMRMRYVPPARIYIFMSFIFFFLLSMLFNSNVSSTTDKMQASFKKGTSNQAKTVGENSLFFQVGRDTLAKDTIIANALKSFNHLNLKILDSVHAANNVKLEGFVKRRLSLTYFKLLNDEISFFDIYLKFIKYCSYSLFLFMPFFALLLKVFYSRMHLYYSEFLVFSIYFHTFIFALLIPFLLIEKYFNDGGILFLVLFFGILLYLFLSLKRVYGQSVLKTIIKSILIYGIYLFCLLFVICFALISSAI